MSHDHLSPEVRPSVACPLLTGVVFAGVFGVFYKIKSACTFVFIQI